MSIKEMCKEIKSYNLVASAVGTEKMAIEIRIYDINRSVELFSFKGTTYGSFKRAIIDKYPHIFADVLFAYNKFGFNEDSKLGDNIVSVRVCALLDS